MPSSFSNALHHLLPSHRPAPAGTGRISWATHEPNLLCPRLVLYRAVHFTTLNAVLTHHSCLYASATVPHHLYHSTFQFLSIRARFILYIFPWIISTYFFIHYIYILHVPSLISSCVLVSIPYSIPLPFRNRRYCLAVPATQLVVFCCPLECYDEFGYKRALSLYHTLSDKKTANKCCWLAGGLIMRLLSLSGCYTMYSRNGGRSHHWEYNDLFLVPLNENLNEHRTKEEEAPRDVPHPLCSRYLLQPFSSPCRLIVNLCKQGTNSNSMRTRPEILLRRWKWSRSSSGLLEAQTAIQE